MEYVSEIKCTFFLSFSVFDDVKQKLTFEQRLSQFSETGEKKSLVCFSQTGDRCHTVARNELTEKKCCLFSIIYLIRKNTNKGKFIDYICTRLRTEPKERKKKNRLISEDIKYICISFMKVERLHRTKRQSAHAL